MPGDTRSRAALGALKETIGAIGHLDEMLRSPRVAAKAIATVLPDVGATLPALQSELEAALKEQSQRFDTVVLFEYLKENVAALAAAIDKATPRGRSMRAGARLELERGLSLLEQRLLGALPLFELMVDSFEPPAGPVDVQELLLLLRQGDQSHGLRGATVDVGVETEGPATWLPASPRSALALISLAASLLGQRVTTTGLMLRVACRATPEGGTMAELSIEAVTPRAAMFKFVIPPSIAPSEACLSSIASTLGVTLAHSSDQLTLRWKPPPGAS
jgi:hypothetical protein